MICLENRGKVTVDINISPHLVDLIPVGKHRSTVLKPENLPQGNCCAENQCLQKVLSVGQMKKACENFCQDNSTYESQRRYIFNWLDQNQPTVGEFAYYISGLRVCWNAWTKVLGITQRRFFQLKKEYLLGRCSSQHGASVMYRDRLQTEAVVNFLEKYFSENCDYMPNCSVWHLTSSSRKKEVFEEFTETMKSTGQPTSSESLFRSIWNSRFPHVKIPKVNEID